MMNRRLRMQGLPGRAQPGSMLECPLPSESVDCVFSIGRFASVTVQNENCDYVTIRGRVLAPLTSPGHWAGLDLYAAARK